MIASCGQRNCPSGNIQRPLWWDASWRCLVFFTFIFRTKGRHTFHITWWTHGMQIKIFIFNVHILRKSYIYIWFVIFVLQIGLGALIGFVAMPWHLCCSQPFVSSLSEYTKGWIKYHFFYFIKCGFPCLNKWVYLISSYSFLSFTKCANLKRNLII